ncbi:hypothetical protein [Streptomyces sp. NBC_00648]|uniref:hypothetical protein n=1 Tax=Streptomyces sp. NBC_00648 TaxID=2975797 RepID=UPI00324C09E1
MAWPTAEVARMSGATARTLRHSWRIADHFPTSEQAAAATGDAAREFARPVARRALNQVVTVELTAGGAVRWQLSWSHPAAPRYPTDGFEDLLEAALDATIADQPDTEPLRKLVLARASV